MPAPNYNQYPAASVTVTTTPQQLYALLLAIDSTIAPRAREINLQNDPGNTAGTNIRIGGSASSTTGVVSPTNCGYVLTLGTTRTYRDDNGDNSVPFTQIWVRTDSGTAQLNVEFARS